MNNYAPKSVVIRLPYAFIAGCRDILTSYYVISSCSFSRENDILYRATEHLLRHLTQYNLHTQAYIMDTT
jgi:hypothetical protein